MIYKGYKIYANSQRTIFYELSGTEELGKEVQGINYQQLDDNLWFSVVDPKDNWVLQSFESTDECKDYIEEIKKG